MATKRFSCEYLWDESPRGCHAIPAKNIGWKVPSDHQAFFLPIFLGQSLGEIQAILVVKCLVVVKRFS